MKTYIKIFTLLLFVILLQGCMTKMWLDSSSSRTYYKNTVDTDNIAFLTTPKVADDSIILVGEKYFYHLNDKNPIKRFNIIKQYLNPKFMKISDNLEVRLQDEKSNIYTNFEILYNKPKNTYSQEEEKAFKELGCSTYNKLSLCRISLWGKIYKKDKNNSDFKSIALSKTFNVTLVVPKSHISLDSILALPIALAIDVVVIPITAILMLFEN